MNTYWLSVLCYICWLLFYVGISISIPRVRNAVYLVYRLRSINKEARALYNFALIFVLLLVPIQSVFTAQLLTGIH